MPGMALPAERKLALLLKSSRNTVREVLRILQIQGIVEIRQGSGCYVLRLPTTDSLEQDQTQPAPSANIKELLSFKLEGRKILIPRLAHLAVQRLGEMSLEKLEATLIGLSQALLKRDFVRMAQEDNRFHMILAQSSGNPLFLAMFEPLQFCPETIVSLLQNVNDGDIQKIFTGYVGILKAIRKSDIDVIEEQVEEILDTMKNLMDREPVSKDVIVLDYKNTNLGATYDLPA